MRLALVFLSGLICVAGCSRPQRSLVGTWETFSSSQKGKVTFKSDNTFTSFASAPLMDLYVEGYYEIKGDNLRRRVLKWQVSKQKLTPDQIEETNRIMKKDVFATISWSDENNIRISSPQGEFVTARRVAK